MPKSNMSSMLGFCQSVFLQRIICVINMCELLLLCQDSFSYIYSKYMVSFRCKQNMFSMQKGMEFERNMSIFIPSFPTEHKPAVWCISGKAAGLVCRTRRKKDDLWNCSQESVQESSLRGAAKKSHVITTTVETAEIEANKKFSAILGSSWKLCYVGPRSADKCEEAKRELLSKLPLEQDSGSISLEGQVNSPLEEQQGGGTSKGQVAVPSNIPLEEQQLPSNIPLEGQGGSSSSSSVEGRMVPGNIPLDGALVEGHVVPSSIPLEPGSSSAEGHRVPKVAVCSRFSDPVDMSCQSLGRRLPACAPARGVEGRNSVGVMAWSDSAKDVSTVFAAFCQVKALHPSNALKLLADASRIVSICGSVVSRESLLVVTTVFLVVSDWEPEFELFQAERVQILSLLGLAGKGQEIKAAKARLCMALANDP